MLRPRPRSLANLLDMETFLKRFDAACKIYKLWESHIREIYEYCLPQRNLLTQFTEGAKKTQKVFDSTAIEALQDFAGEIQTALIPPFRRWIKLEAGSEVPEGERDRVNELLEEYTETLFDAIDHSNLATAAHETLLDLAIGTGALLVQNGTDERPLNFTNVPLARLRIEKGPSGAVETVYHPRSVKARELSRIWPAATWHEKTQRIIHDEPEREVDVIEAVLSIEELHQHHYVVVEPKLKHYALTQALDQNPYIVPRWLVAGDETYGRGPAMVALPDIKTLNKIVEFVMRHAAKVIAPPLLVNDGSTINAGNIRLAPNAVNIVNSPSGKALDAVAPLQSGGDFQFADVLTADLKLSIKRKFFADELPDPTDPTKTATELLIRQQRLLKRIGSSFGRLQAELILQVVKKSTAILIARGKLAPITIDGREVNIKYVGPLAQAQDKDDLLQLDEFMARVQQLGPAVALTTVKIDEIPAYIAEKLGVPEQLVRDEAERKQIQATAAQLAQDAADANPDAARQDPAATAVPSVTDGVPQ